MAKASKKKPAAAAKKSAVKKVVAIGYPQDPLLSLLPHQTAAPYFLP